MHEVIYYLNRIYKDLNLSVRTRMRKKRDSGSSPKKFRPQHCPKYLQSF